MPAVLLVPARRSRGRGAASTSCGPAGAARAWLALARPGRAPPRWSALLPVLRTNGFAIGNDTYTYCAFSEWLQHHGFSETCRLDPFSPVTGIPWLWQACTTTSGSPTCWRSSRRPRGAPSLAARLPGHRGLRDGGGRRRACSWPRATAPAPRLAPGPAARRSSSRSCRTPSTGGTTTASSSRRYALAVLLLGVVLLARSARPPRFSLGNAVLVRRPVRVPAGRVPAAPPRSRPRRRARARPGLPPGAPSRGRCAASPRGRAAWPRSSLLLGLRDLVGVVLRMRGFMTDVAGGHVPSRPSSSSSSRSARACFAPGSTSVESWPWTRAQPRAGAPLPSASPSYGLGLALRRERSRGLGGGRRALRGRDPVLRPRRRGPLEAHGAATPGTCSSCASGPAPSSCCWPPLGLRGARPQGHARGRGSSCRRWLSSLPSASLGAHWAWSERLGTHDAGGAPGRQAARGARRP